jgi:hypothetical protein
MPQIDVNLPVAFIKEGDSVIAYTPALDISTAGKNEAEAKERFGELVRMFFADLVENNTIDAVLSELGWHKDAQVWNPPTVSQQSVNVRVPVLA